MKKSILILALCIPLLNGCAVFDFFKKPNNPITERIAIDPKLLQACDNLSPLPKDTSDVDVAEHHVQVIGTYGICKIKQDTSIKTIRRLANLPD